MWWLLFTDTMPASTSPEHFPVNNVLHNSIAHALVLGKTLLCWVTPLLRTAFTAYEFPQTTSLSEASPLYHSGLSCTRRLSCCQLTCRLFSCSSVAQRNSEICLHLPRTLQIFSSVSEIAAGTLEEKDHAKPFSRALLLLSLVLMTKNPFCLNLGWNRP